MVFSPPIKKNSRPWKNLRIGLFGGTFNPPHAGHVHVCTTALKTGEFDFIWWMVTPQNPLKKDQKIPAFETRLEWSREKISHPRVLVSDIERQLGTYKTIDTVRAIKKHFPNTDFTFLVGTDNALCFHRWEEWRQLIKEIKFLFIARPPASSLLRNCPLKMQDSLMVSWILENKLSPYSSTILRCNQADS